MLERLRRRLPDAEAVDDDLLLDLLDEAMRFVCAYTLRKRIPEALEGVCVELAAIFFNRMGMEGETSHNEGGVSRTVQALPEDIAASLRPWRLARTMHGDEQGGAV
ncbi:MAG: phage head-tail connector protein [Clostridia bacterium]|nr:phage head-tail connector protein [Clostridia bacterium]